MRDDYAEHVLDVEDAVVDCCRGAEGLQAAIIFGSVLDREHPGDLDLALLWDPELTHAQRWQRASRIAADLEHRLTAHDLNVDVKDLRALPLVLQHRVLRDGRVACAADRRALVRFNYETVPRALDFLPFHRRMLTAAARRTAKGASQ